MAINGNKISKMTKNSDFLRDVELGLSQTPKTLSSKYFYDEIGDALFQKIMAMPEYYLTKSEAEIFQHQNKEIISSFEMDKNVPFELIELGAGDGSKTRYLLEELLKQGYQFTYVPIDISHNALEIITKNMCEKFPDLKIMPKQGEYFQVLDGLFESENPKVLLFIGSNLGNMMDEVSKKFIHQIAKDLKAKDKLLLGLDLIKSAEIVLPAYNDAKGITKEFNLNLLQRMNIELGADFETEQFQHIPEYTEQEGIARSSIKSLKRQMVHFSVTGNSYQFEEGEKIHTEISRKYNDDVLNKILKDSNFKIKHKFIDSRGYFADYILERT